MHKTSYIVSTYADLLKLVNTSSPRHHHRLLLLLQRRPLTPFIACYFNHPPGTLPQLLILKYIKQIHWITSICCSFTALFNKALQYIICVHWWSDFHFGGKQYTSYFYCHRCLILHLCLIFQILLYKYTNTVNIVCISMRSSSLQLVATDVYTICPYNAQYSKCYNLDQFWLQYYIHSEWT